MYIKAMFTLNRKRRLFSPFAYLVYTKTTKNTSAKRTPVKTKAKVKTETIKMHSFLVQTQKKLPWFFVFVY